MLGNEYGRTLPFTFYIIIVSHFCKRTVLGNMSFYIELLSDYWLDLLFVTVPLDTQCLNARMFLVRILRYTVCIILLQRHLCRLQLL